MTNLMQTEEHTPAATVSRLHTPYHALGDTGGVRIPTWAKHRSVYRGAGRTTYLVETDEADAAGDDLMRLATSGWNVHVERRGDSNVARITVSQDDLERAA